MKTNFNFYYYRYDFFSFSRKNDPDFYRKIIHLSVILIIFVIMIFVLDLFRYYKIQANITNLKSIANTMQESEKISVLLQKHDEKFKNMKYTERADATEIQKILLAKADKYKLSVDKINALNNSATGNTISFEMKLSGKWEGTMNFLHEAFESKEYLANVFSVNMDVDQSGNLNTLINYKIYTKAGEKSEIAKTK